ncbi:MAG: methylamine utilization protein [Betaproteobacteria bacterium]|nr:methylamine utilization protein [Betaproteobacteria bacterium]
MAIQPSVRAGELRAQVVDGDAQPLPDAVVVAFPVDARIPPARPGTEVEDQIDKEFVPYVQAIRVGSYVKFPNKDDIRHHVYSFSPAKKFALPLYSGTPATPVLFDKMGVVKLGCNIHDWMIGYLYVTDAPYFGKTAAQGQVELKDVHAGTYRVRVWHPRLDGTEESTTQQIEVKDNAPASAQWALKLKREFRPRRAPSPGDPGYR